jgi:hypothetical protein
MRELEFVAMQLQQSVMRLQEGLETSATGRLFSILIPPHNLSKILEEVILKLSQDVSLIAGFIIENMYIYYDVAKSASVCYYNGYSPRSANFTTWCRSSHDPF